MTYAKLILIHGTIYSLCLAVALLLMILANPRLMLQDYPKSIRQSVQPKTKREKLGTFTWGLPFILTILFYPFLLGLYYAQLYNLGFGGIMAFVWGVTMFFNLFDLLIIDWLIVCLITPKFVIIPGTEGNKGYKDYQFHFIGFLKGIIITFTMSLVISGLISVIVHSGTSIIR